MRSDLVAYTIAIICFIVGLLIPFQLGFDLIPTALMIAFALFGFFFIMFGYSLRPRKIVILTRPKIEPSPAIPQEKAEELPPAISTAEVKPIELTQVKGIGPKRASQLKNVGILTAQDLEKASAIEIATKLKISEKIAEKWIQEAKTLKK